ncbi:hypothetical protein [Pseudomonas benzopyrenica]
MSDDELAVFLLVLAGLLSGVGTLMALPVLSHSPAELSGALLLIG